MFRKNSWYWRPGSGQFFVSVTGFCDRIVNRLFDYRFGCTENLFVKFQMKNVKLKKQVLTRFFIPLSFIKLCVNYFYFFVDFFFFISRNVPMIDGDYLWAKLAMYLRKPYLSVQAQGQSVPSK